MPADAEVRPMVNGWVSPLGVAMSVSVCFVPSTQREISFATSSNIATMKCQLLSDNTEFDVAQTLFRQDSIFPAVPLSQLII